MIAYLYAIRLRDITNTVCVIVLESAKHNFVHVFKIHAWELVFFFKLKRNYVSSLVWRLHKLGKRRNSIIKKYTNKEHCWFLFNIEAT